MSSNVDRSADHVEHSKPIPINTRRGRSYSVSDSSSSEESCSPSSPVSPLQSPLTGNAPRIAPLSPGATPILNYFLTHSPAKSPSSATSATFPFRRGFGSAVFDSDDSEPDAVNATTTKHNRRASTAWAGADRFAPPAPQQQPPQQPPVAVPDQSGRAAGLLRRLSLGGAALRPQMPQPQAKSATAAPADRARTPPTSASPSARKARRATFAPGTARPKRAPSPMGERILTGHFDGFN